MMKGRSKPMKRKVIAFLLLTVMIFSYSACGDTAADDVMQNAETNIETVQETTGETEPLFKDNLPDDLDFEGETFDNFVYESSWLHTRIDREEQDGDILNDAIYLRNRLVENRLNVLFKESISSGFTAMNQEAKKIVMSGEDIYDVFFCEDYPTLTLAQMGMIVNFREIPYIDLSQPYWSHSLNPELSIHSRLYFAYSDFNLTPSDYTHVLVFNKQIHENFNLKNIYDLVNNGAWDYDEYEEMCSAVTEDVDGDNEMTKTDRYGYLSQPKHVLPCFWSSAGVKSIAKNEDDIPEFKLAGDKKFAEVVERIFTITWDNNTWFRNKFASNSDLTLNDMFVGGQALFFDNTLFYIAILRGMEQDFGVIPYPKYDESQEEYYSRVEGGCVPSVPVTAAGRLEMIGAVLEALSSESANSVIPAYFEISLKGKYARDNESAEMLDLIYRTRSYDLGDTYWCETLRDGIFMTMFEKNKRDFVSSMTNNESRINKAINKVIEAFEKLDI